VTKPFSLAFKQKMMARLTGNDAVSAREGRRTRGKRPIDRPGSPALSLVQAPRPAGAIEHGLLADAVAAIRAISSQNHPMRRQPDITSALLEAIERLANFMIWRRRSRNTVHARQKWPKQL
jgi:transposase